MKEFTPASITNLEIKLEASANKIIRKVYGGKL